MQCAVKAVILQRDGLTDIDSVFKPAAAADIFGIPKQIIAVGNGINADIQQSAAGGLRH